MLTETEKEAPKLSEHAQRGLNIGPPIALGKTSCFQLSFGIYAFYLVNTDRK